MSAEIAATLTDEFRHSALGFANSDDDVRAGGLTFNASLCLSNIRRL